MPRQPIKLDDSRYLIPLTRGAHAIVDEVDVEFLTQWDWNLSGKYARRYVSKGGHHQVPMHGVVFERGGGELQPLQIVDHKDGNYLHNCRSNLRAATQAQNVCNVGLKAHNTSGIIGVKLDAKGRWEAYIQHQGDVHLKRFDTVEEAVQWRNELGFRLRGEFYVPSVIPEGWVPVAPAPLTQDSRLDEADLARRLLENEILRARLAKL